MVIILLHLLILPSVSGAYNDGCYLSESKLNELRHLILTSAKLMEKYEMMYWLDFGKRSLLIPRTVARNGLTFAFLINFLWNRIVYVCAVIVTQYHTTLI